MGQHGVVAAAHPLASLAGIDTLRRGGHAVDAAIATNAVLAVVQPHMCGVGGDFFCLIRSADSGEISFLNASGRAPKLATRELVRSRGHTSVPFRGGLPVTVPGCVDGWATAWERFGRLGWESLFANAIELANEGFPASRHLSAWIDRERDVLAESDELRGIFLPGGDPLRPGQLLRQPELGETMRSVSLAGRDGFYRDDVADLLSSGILAAGGVLDQADLDAHKSEWGAPISTRYRNATVHTTGGNTQGVVALIALNIIEAYELSGFERNGTEHVHLCSEAAKIALPARDVLSDTGFVDVPWGELTSKEYAARLATDLRMDATVPVRTVYEGGDTTAYSVADRDGNLVSGIQSIYAPFGAGVMPRGTGVILQNRGAYFSLDGDHPNALEPHKRPLHTLMATIVSRDSSPVLAFGTMGGAGQPQTHVQVITNVLDYGLTIQAAIEAPRWLHGDLFIGVETGSLQMEGRFPRSTIEGLRGLGHRVTLVDDWTDQMGHAQGIVVDGTSGVYQGGADPRGDGFALGY